MNAGWKTSSLGQVCSFLNRGISPKYLDDGGICVLNQRCVRDHIVNFEPARRHDANVKKVGSERHIRAGDVLVNSTGTGTLGRVAQLREDPLEATTVDSHVTIVRPVPGKFYTEFFGYMLMFIEDAIKDAGEGCGGQTELARSTLAEKFLVHYPESLAEQQRIVGILDEAFDSIATAKANAEKNLQNAHALFESHLQSFFIERGEGWAHNKLKKLTIKIGSGATPKGGEEEYMSEGVSLIRSLNVHDFGFRYPKLAFLDDDQADDLSNVEVLHGDVLLNITGASVARCCIVPDDVLPARVNQHVSIIRPINERLDSEFLHYLLISKPNKDRLLQTGAEGGSTRQAITKAQIQDFDVEYPEDISEQKSITAKLDLVLAETERFESLYRRKIIALEELKKSLLHQAFTGKFTQRQVKSTFDLFPTKIANITPIDLHAGILAMAYQLHEKQGNQATFGHVKAEKIAHMVEAFAGIDLGRSPIKDAAGPNDHPHFMRVEHRARKAGYFSFRRVEASAYRVTKHRNFDALVERTCHALGARKAQVESLLKLMLPMETRQAEIFSTVYAAWNNLLLDGQTITNEKIVLEARDNWHPDKMKIQPEKFFKAIEWMRKNDFVPLGKGKKVASKGN
jgi:type I restriction enzyme S subunit